MSDDEDEFLYGPSITIAPPAIVPAPILPVISTASSIQTLTATSAPPNLTSVPGLSGTSGLDVGSEDVKMGDVEPEELEEGEEEEEEGEGEEEEEEDDDSVRAVAGVRESGY